MADEKSPNAIRMRRYRQRQRDGVQVVTVEVNQDMIETLLITRQLDRDVAGDPQAISQAIKRLMKKA